jgi:MFS family permease
MVAAVAALVYVSTPRFAVFLVAEVLFAVSFTLMSGADEALVYDTLAQLNRSHMSKRSFARLESFKLAGIVVGALCGGVIAKWFGLRVPLLLQAVPCVLSGVLALTLAEPAGAVAVRGAASYLRLLRGGVRYFRSHPVLRVLAFDMVSTGAFSWLIIWMYQPQLERVGVDLAFFGVVHAAMCIGQIALLSNIERVEALAGSRRRYLLISAVLPGLAFVVLGATAHVTPAVIAILVAASVGLSRPPLFISYMNKYIPSEQRATVLSTISMLRTLAVAVVNPIAGWLADWSIQSAMVILGVAAIALALVTRVEERHLID